MWQETEDKNENMVNWDYLFRLLKKYCRIWDFRFLIEVKDLDKALELRDQLKSYLK